MSNLQNPANTSIYVQPGGPGNALVYVDGESQAAAYSGGGSAFESDFAGGRYKGSRVTQNPARTTVQVSARRKVTSALRSLAASPSCLPSLYIFSGCPPQYLAKFSMLLAFIDAGVASNGVSGNVADTTSIADPKLMDQLSLDAGLLAEGRPLAHSDISGTVTIGPLNHVLRIGSASCPGACGPQMFGNEEFLMVGDGKAPATVPNIYYTANGGNTWTQQTMAAVLNGAAEWVALAGNRVLVAVSGTNGGIFTAPLSAVKLGTAVFQLANGITAGHVYRSIIAVDPMTVIAVGDSGRIAVSVDGGFSFSLATSPVATALNVVAAGCDKNLVWIGGASAVVIRLKNLAVAEQLTVAGIGADAVTAVAVPLDRTSEVYLGTATGEIHRSRNGYDALPTWEELNFDKPTGGGIIEYIDFIPLARQAVMGIVQSNASTQSRVLIDYTGGAAGAGCVELGSFTSPPNTIINALALTDYNFGLTCGEIETVQSFIGRIAG